VDIPKRLKPELELIDQISQDHKVQAVSFESATAVHSMALHPV